MNLKKKKILAAKALKVGKNRIVFLESRLDDLKEAITKQDIRDLYKEKAIIIKNMGGRKGKKKKRKKSFGNVRKNLNRRKRNYIIMARKLRGYILELKKQGKIPREKINEIRKKIKNKEFRSKAHLNEYLFEGEK